MTVRFICRDLKDNSGRLNIGSYVCTCKTLTFDLGPSIICLHECLRQICLISTEEEKNGADRHPESMMSTTQRQRHEKRPRHMYWGSFLELRVVLQSKVHFYSGPVVALQRSLTYTCSKTACVLVEIWATTSRKQLHVSFLNKWNKYWIISRAAKNYSCQRTSWRGAQNNRLLTTSVNTETSSRSLRGRQQRGFQRCFDRKNVQEWDVLIRTCPKCSRKI